MLAGTGATRLSWGACVGVTGLLALVAVVSFHAGAGRLSTRITSQRAQQTQQAPQPAPPPRACTLQQLENATEAIRGGRPDKSKQDGRPEDLPNEFRMPTDTLAERTFVTRLDQAARFIASPSILALPSGRLLVLFEKQAAWGVHAPETASKEVWASDDGGASWQHVGSPSPLHWPSIFQCASGVYIVGVQRHFSADNNIVITKMMDAGGVEWSPISKISTGLSVVMANTGVDVSWGRVTKAFEIIPVKASPVKESVITSRVELPVDMTEPWRASWNNPPIANVTVEDSNGSAVHPLVQDSRGFAINTLVEVPSEPHSMFFRILALDHARNVVQLRMERFTLFWILEPVAIEAGTVLKVGSGAHIYGAVDWVSMAMSADESQDLTKAEAWTFTEPLGNPASVRSREMAALFDVAFRPDYTVRKSIIGFDHDFIKDYTTALDAGFGSLYWMEGVVVRLQDRRGSSGKLLVTLRVNNDLMCDLSALVALDDSSLRPDPAAAAAAEAAEAASDNKFRRRLRADAEEVAQEGVEAAPTQEPALEREFLRFRNTPGLAIGHPAIVYDNATDLYWMASNVNRDSTRVWRQPWQPQLPKLHITLFSKCEVDRTTMGLFYSPNALDWWPAGVIDYHLDFAYHFTYPHMTIAGDDLLVVMRATAPAEEPSQTISWYNNHNSNSVSFHRIRDFRRLANVAWATYEGQYTLRPRAVSSMN